MILSSFFSRLGELAPAAIALLSGSLAYAEIHYRLAGLPSRLFQREPEILFDLPHRARIGKSVPLFLLIKDAHRYPVELGEIRIEAIATEGGINKKLILSAAATVNREWHAPVFELPPDFFDAPGLWEVNITLNYAVKGRSGTLTQDNYPGIPHAPFQIFIAEGDLPRLPGLKWGDLHVHSNYTNSQIEFGAPLPHLVRCAGTLDLDFLAVTDHSFDLDRRAPFSRQRDPQLTNWGRFQAECLQYADPAAGPVILPGEEVSTGNVRGENVHCLVLGAPEFFPGRGDGGEIPPFNHPTLFLPELILKAKRHPGAVVAAAHPRDNPPFFHRLILRRGRWHRPDLHQPGIGHWQILNGRGDRAFREGLKLWVEALLDGRRIGILGGTDAHGNFNTFRQITIPMWKMVRNQQQLLGQIRTGVWAEGEPTPANILKAIAAKASIVSCGPAGNLTLVQDDGKFGIGASARAHHPTEVRIEALSTAEYGPLTRIELHIGDLQQKQERPEILEISAESFHFRHTLTLPKGLAPGYLRLVVFAENGRWRTFCYSNPVWVG
ncbi:MAG TPA: CehA/McbA family metallohydrolase [Calditrichia bacterium]|nr:CehA/McbA family metallohydrolase [Calditrichia bacterium]